VFICSTINSEENNLFNDCDNLNLFNSSTLFTSPCIKIISIKQCKNWLRQKFFNLYYDNNNNIEDKNKEMEENFNLIESQLFENKNGILQSLCFEQFISRLRLAERSWPYSFRSW
jgi:hypothetical protein